MYFDNHLKLILHLHLPLVLFRYQNKNGVLYIIGINYVEFLEHIFKGSYHMSVGCLFNEQIKLLRISNVFSQFFKRKKTYFTLCELNAEC